MTRPGEFRVGWHLILWTILGALIWLGIGLAAWWIA